MPSDVSTQRVGATTHANGTSEGSSSASAYGGTMGGVGSMSVATSSGTTRAIDFSVSSSSTSPTASGSSSTRHGGSLTRLSSASSKADDHSNTAVPPSTLPGNRSSAGRTKSDANIGSMPVFSAQPETKSGAAEVIKALTKLPAPIQSQPPPPLICVFEERMNTTMEFPEDGMCDYVFYSASEPDNGMGLMGPFHDKFKHFLANAMTQEATEYGLGLDFNRIADHKQVLQRPDAFVILENIMKRGISHFGYLNTKVYGFGKQHLKATLMNLKVTAHQAVKEMKHLSPNVTMAVSVGLYGRWYKPSNGKTMVTSQRKKYSVQQECAHITEFQLGNIADVCKSQNYQKTYYDEAHHAMVAYNEDLERMFVYDDENALNAKLCTAKGFYHNLKYGVAAYNLEYADGTDVCGAGEYPRIRALRRITKSLANAFVSPHSVGDCTYNDHDTTKQVPRAARRQTPLICVFSDRLQPPMKHPKSGLCDYVYFDSMELKKDTTGLSGTLQKSFQYFLMLALENKMRAEYGIGFNYQ
ncbi:hypothetical protein HPB49_002094 [Dermacentor silvarum]|uniref:Uncharacterized protein n=1 Tax=Dermacentor silvarum TaxID=543639 RepID=A0ACB8DMD9_DERSI|nr:hypothetical protein HPB49_002094 [Dermacentor silvarum]